VERNLYAVKLLKKLSVFLGFTILILLVARFLLLPHIFPKRYQAYVEQYAEKYLLESSFVYAVIFTESHFRPDAVSPKNAKGLMQITDKTGQWGAEAIGRSYSDKVLFDPEANIEIGCWYMNKLMVQFHDKEETVLAAYNAGSGNVSKWLADEKYSDDGLSLKEIPFGETKRYVKKVLITKKIYEVLYGREY
jgi:soluble lytic murein transglycosylase